MADIIAKEILSAEKVNIGQVYFNRWMENTISFANKMGLPKEAIDNIKKEWLGGRCFISQTQYEKMKAERSFGEGRFRYSFEYYTPTCGCEKKEKTERDQGKQLEKRMETAGVPFIYMDVDWYNWDRGVSEETNESFDRVHDYFVKERCFLKDASGIILYGDIGTGKTRTAICVLREIIKKTDWRVAYLQTGGIISRMVDKEKGNKYVKELEDYDAILFDDMDKMHVGNTWIQERIFTLIDQMVGKKKVIIGTANFGNAGDFIDKFGDSIMSRIINACYMEHFTGRDYRTK